MSASDVSTLLAAAGGFLLVLGGGAKWLLAHIETLRLAAELKETAARSALSERLQHEISDLRQELTKLQVEKAIYLRRIYQLESLIHRLPDVEIPVMEGWPPV